MAFDRALIYATGGFAFADDATGWTLGGGLEYAFTNNLSAKIEGLYVNLDQDDTFPGLDLDKSRVRCGSRWSELPLRHLLRSVSPETDEKARGNPGPFCF